MGVVCSGRAGSVCATCGGLAGSGETEYGLGLSRARPSRGDPPAGEGLTLSFRPGGSISQSEVSTVPEATADQPKHEPERELLG